MPDSEQERPWLTRSVFAIAIASLLSDACYELIIPLLPAFITSLGGGPAALGLMEGLADGIAFPFKLAGGVLADRTKRRRAFTMAGYLGVGLFMPAIALMQSTVGVITMRAVAWASRGFRSPIRDTLLVDDTNPKYINRAFGFQRALDTVGAVIGPAVAMAFIALGVQTRNAILFGVVPGVLAGLSYLFVTERPRSVPPRAPLHLALAGLPKTFLRYLVAAGVFGAGNFSATLLVLVAMQALEPHMGGTLAVTYSTGLYLLHNAIQASMSYPASLLSERMGVGRLLAVAFALFTIVAAIIAFASTSIAAVVVAFVIAAVGVAIVEPMEGTFATQLLPADRRGTGYGVLASINGVGDFISSAGVGLLWQYFGSAIAFGSAAALCGAGTLLLLPLAFQARTVKNH
ncbi:MAG TPA: MFS transporter [Candidatus Eremiobacteraceae bacterium]|nr:MFS transporter [Candidatus Eremiobacteraceae bacterium]